MLYPRESETREVKDLSGVWQFKPDYKGHGFRKSWFKQPLSDAIMMPVPASYNDITQDPELRDHIGDVWYEQTFLVPASWCDKAIVLRFGSVTHKATVWVNGKYVTEHKGGFTPFEADIASIVDFGKTNRVTVAVNNVLDWTTLPPGYVKPLSGSMYPNSCRTQLSWHDFFNYAGIHRPVLLCAMPKTHVADISVATDYKGTTGLVKSCVTVEGGKADVETAVLDEHGNEIARGIGKDQTLTIKNVKLWQPGKAYLYTLAVKLWSRDKVLIDSYCLPFGVRTIKVAGKDFLINGKPFYFRGFGKHEDTEIRGKGLDHALNIKDFNLLKWIGANSIRTSHYPYAEEFMYMADRLGIVVIDESPAVGMRFNTPGMQGDIFCKDRLDSDVFEHHVQVLKEMIARDKNHPCVVMWSVANEPATFEKGSQKYFKKIAEITRKLDPGRPITLVNCSEPEKCRVAQYFDVISYNQYFSWYTDSGRLEFVEHQLEHTLKTWYKLFQKPVLMSEYGADAVSGLHCDPPLMFSEEYQCQLLHKYHTVFDRLNFIIGEHVWNFADFATKQDITRVVGNRKGVFSRSRQPKAAAHLLRDRWTKAK